MFEHIEDPLERLEFVETALVETSTCLEQLSHLVREQSRAIQNMHLFVQQQALQIKLLTTHVELMKTGKHQ